MIKFQKLKITLVVCFTLFVAMPALAAQVFFESKTTRVRIGEKFEVMLLVNSEQESVNAFEGKIIFPKNILDLKDIRDGNSIVNFWIERPKNQSGVITFSGITPGGFNGDKGLIFSAIFEAKKEGTAKFVVNNARVLRNDGSGSETTLAVVPLEIIVSKGTPAEISAFQEVKDRERPESFAPEIAKNQALFDGRWFVVFTTQDKNSGIDYYELKESRQKFLTFFSKWKMAESPSVLEDQNLRSHIFIKAVDKSGNERIVAVSPGYPLKWYENYENWIIIMIGAVIVLIWRKKMFLNF